MALSDTAIKKAKPKNKPYKMYDEKGLFIQIPKTGSRGGKRWRLKYKFLGKEKLLSLGIYPEVSLSLARQRRDEILTQLAKGIDPSEHRKVQKSIQSEVLANSFEAIAREWILKQSKIWSEVHYRKNIRLLERDIFPYLGSKPITEITSPQLLSVLRQIEKRGAVDTAHRALNKCGGIFRYAISTCRAERDLSADLKGALSPVKKGHFAAITEPSEVAPFLKTIEAYEGTPVVQAALKLSPLVFVRPTELRHALWSDIDFESAEWRYTPTKTENKTQVQHIVPLSRQAVSILKEIQPLTGRSKYVFHSARSMARPMSENAITGAFKRMEISKDKMTGHGFRAMARTILDEALGFRVDYIEQQLAHEVKDPNGRAYNRTKHLPERKKMMQAWSDYLDQLKAGSNVVAIHSKANKI
jgi:integrase